MRIHSGSRLGVGLAAVLTAIGCSGSDEGSLPAGGSSGTTPTASGGQASVGGGALVGGATTVPAGGGSVSVGGSGPVLGSGGSAVGAGGNSTIGSGGTTSSPTLGGATSAGGAVGTGGSAAKGGSVGAGGSAAKGGTTSAGGSTAKGGTTSAGGSTAKGGTTSAGGSTAKGGTTSAGGSTAKGGTTSAGGSTGACTPTWESPPSNVSAWIDESWNSQLSSNIKSRQAWLLDSIMKGKGQINLCVRWGATSAPSAAVKSGMAAAVEKWFNDWIANLSGYGCFPYTSVTTKVTGWAVKPGNTSWVSDLDSSIKVYTEVDGEGEPKCSDSCSFFTNWNHTFPNCPGGEAFHHDYWLWLDDSIGGGAAAVGGDWGLRMPVSNFISAMNKSNLVIEHEIGHGFGFQDYYEWTGSRPTGGSLMIVGSTNSQVPTTADTWLLRRTWKEMKTLRGW